ncbi:MAG: magnesium/cobalt transporter CorA [Chitinophagales bacterium]
MPRKKSVKRGRRKLGLPPGSLVYIGEKEGEKVSLDLFKFKSTELKESSYEKFEELGEKPEADYSYWLNVNGLSDVELISKLTKQFGLDELLVEDIMNTTQRPKIDEFPPHLFLTLKMIQYNTEKNELDTEQISLVLGENYMLSFQEKKGDVFDAIRNRIRAEGSNVRNKKSDYLFYRLIDIVVDHYFILTEHIDERIEEMEMELFQHFREEQLNEIQDIKKMLLHLKRQIVPLKESINTLEIMDSPLMVPDTKKFIKDIHDHLKQIIDNIESEKDLVGMLMDVYLNRQSNETNRVMKVLTIIATIFIPLTFLVGIYGMNFEYMPELQWKYSYPIVMGLMIVLVIAMLVFFKRKKWI